MGDSLCFLQQQHKNWTALIGSNEDKSPRDKYKNSISRQSNIIHEKSKRERYHWAKLTVWLRTHFKWLQQCLCSENKNCFNLNFRKSGATLSLKQHACGRLWEQVTYIWSNCLSSVAESKGEGRKKSEEKKERECDGWPNIQHSIISLWIKCSGKLALECACAYH